jgi:uncharacterized phosphosugar-binding protein
MSGAALRYQERLLDVLRAALSENAEAVREAGTLVARTFARQGLVHIFGSGHSHMLAEEAFYRAGGAARVCPVLVPRHMLHEGVVLSTRLERESGHAEAVLADYPMDPERDCLLVASNSGANALPVEVAELGRARGVPVIALTSRAYSDAITRPGRRLHEVADVVLDNRCPPGDALVELGEGLPSAGPASSVVGMALLNSVILAAVGHQIDLGQQPELFVSANMPGAAEHNARLVEDLGHRVPHL